MSNAIFTSCDLNYLDRALLLANTVKDHNPDIVFYLMLSDDYSEEYFAISCFSSIDHVISTEQIGIPAFWHWSFSHDVIELCTAVKGFCLDYLINLGHEKIIYLDPDIACFSSVQFIFDLLDSYSIGLTPHRISPAESYDDLIDNEFSTYKYGIYNLGFLCINASDEAKIFTKWWKSRLESYCIDDISNGIFTDQKWCDAVPAFFDNSIIIRHPGCNVASWNLPERRVDFFLGDLKVNEVYPLIFYHFTKYFSGGVDMTLRYSLSSAVISVWQWYGREIIRLRKVIPDPPKKGRFMRFNDGRLISGKDRADFRLDPLQFKNDPYEGRL